MKKIYLFIFLIVIGLSQNQSVKANISNVTNKVVLAPPAAQTITFTAFATTQAFGAGDVTLTATATSGLAVTFSSSNTAVATIVNNKIHLVGVGTAVITASQPGNGVTFSAAPNQTQNLTVNAGAKAVISAFPAASVALQSADITPPAASTLYPPATYTSYPITYTSSNLAVITIINNRIHLVATGTATITASQAGNGNFADATPLAAVYTVTAPPAPTFSAVLGNKALGSVDFDPGATLTGTNPYYATITYSNTSAVASTGASAFSIINNKVHLISTSPSTNSITASITYPVGTGGTATVTSTSNTSLVITAAPTTIALPAISLTAPGSKAFSNIDLPLTATSTSAATVPITFTSSNPLVATIVNGNIHYVGVGTSVITASQGGSNQLPLVNVVNLVAGSAYTNGTYTNVPLTGGAGSGAQATIVVSGGAVTSVTLTSFGSAYKQGDVLSATAATIGGTGTGFSIIGLTSNSLPADASSTLTVTVPLISFTAPGSKALTPSDFTPTVTSTLVNVPITLTSSNTAVATIVNGNIHFVGIGTSTITASQATAAGLAGYPLPVDQTSVLTVTAPVGPTSPAIAFLPALGNKSYTNAELPLASTSTAVGAPPITYTSSNPAVAIITNSLTLGAPNGGSNYVNGTYLNVPLTGGSGSGELATIVVSNNIVATVTPTINGSGYLAGDILSCAASNIGGSGSGFNVIVLSLTNNIRYIAALPAPNNVAIITASQGGGVLGNATLPPDVQSTLVVTPATLTLPTLGTKPYTAQDIAVGGVSSVSNKIIVYSSSNPAVATINNIITGTITTGGSGYSGGPYYKVPITGGSGSGATATITITSGAISGVTITANGPVYAINDVLTFPSSATGGAGSGFTYTVTGYTSNIHFNNAVPAAPNNTTVITASQGGGATGTTILPPDVSQTLTVTQPAINFPALGTKQFTSNDLNPGATGSNFATNSISTFNAPSAGSGYTNGTYYAVALTGGSGTGATATITVIGGVVTSAVPVSTGINYLVGDILTAPASSLGGTGSGFQVAVSAVSTGFPITYTSSNPAVATIVNDYIHFTGAGTTIITASQNGPAGINTGNISLPQSVSQSLTVTPPTINFALSGTRTLSSNDVNPGATSTITNIPITYVSSNPAVATITNNSITGVNNILRGAGYANGIYINVPLTGGSGTGATANITVSTVSQIIVGGVVISTTNAVTFITLTSVGSGYTVGDVLSCPVTSLGGTSTNTPFSLTVTSVGSFIHFTGPGAVNITASQGGGATGTINLPADVTQALTVTPPTLNLPVLGSVVLGSPDINPSATSTITSKPITYTSSVSTVAKILANSITGLNNPVGGTGYVIGTYSPVPLIYANGTGTGSGATAQVLVVGGSVTGVTIISGGTGYLANDVLTCDKSLIGGSGTGFTVSVSSAGGVINLVGSPAAPANTTNIVASQGGGPTGAIAAVNAFSTIGGSGYANGTYTSVPLTGGTGTGALATITVAGGSVTSVVIGPYAGSGYKAGDVLSCAAANVGGTGTGFSITVINTIALPADATQALIVTPYKMTMPAFGTQTLTNADLNPGALSTLATVPITYTSSNTAVATIVNGFIHFIGTGSTTITATQGGGAAGTATLPPDVTQSLVVSAPLITFPPLSAALSINATDIAPGASSTVATPAITYSSGNTAVATIVNGNIHVVGVGSSVITASQGGGIPSPLIATSALIGGSAYTNGTYTAVPLTGGAGTGALATIIVSGGSVASVTITAGGTAYKQGNILSTTAASIGGTGTGFSVTGLTSTSAPADQTQTFTVNPTSITLPALGTKQYTDVDFNPGATSTYPGVPFTYYSSNPAVATIVNYPTLSAPISGGTGYTNGTYTAVPLLLNGNTSVTTATVVVAGGSIVAIKSISSVPVNGTVITLPASTSTTVGAGSGFSATVTGSTSMIHLTTLVPTSPNNTTVIAASQGGSVLTNTTTLVGGSGYTNGTYTAVPLIYANSVVGTGSGAQAKIVVAGGVVTSVTITTGGKVYKQGDVLTATAANIGGTGTGFSVTAVTTNTNLFPDDATQTLAVVAPAITFPALGTVTYNNNDINPGAISTVTGIPITYTSDNTAVATIVNGQIHLINGGTTTTPLVANITASQGGGATGANGIPADVKQALSVVGSPVISFTTALGSKAYNTADLAPGVTSTYTLAPITYTSSNTAVATIVNGNIHFMGTGTTTITASQGGGTVSNGTLPIDATSVLTVTAPLISFVATTQLPASKALTDIDAPPGATSTVSTVPITYTSSNTAVATIVNGNVHFLAPGSTTLKASQGGGTTGTATLPADATFTVTVTNPVISFTALTSKAYQINDIGLSATSSLTTIPITYTSSDPNVATIVNNAIHIIGMGTTTITASQTTDAINAGYIAPADVQQSFVVTVPTLSLVALGTKAFTSTDLALTATSTISAAAPVTYTSSDPSVATIVNNTFLHYTGIGTCYITASQASYQGSPVPASSIQNLTVTPAVITFAALGTKLINSGDVTLAATSPLTGPGFVYTSSDPSVASIINGNTLHLVNSGTCVITASQPTPANYAPLPVTSSLIITPAITAISTPTITFQPLGSKPFSNAGDYTPTASASNGAVLSFTSSNPAVATIVNGLIHPTPPSIVNGIVTYPNPNTTVITASAGGGPNGIAGSTPADVSQVLTITPATITFPPLGQQIFPTTPVIANLSQVRFNTNDLAPAATSTYQLLTANNTAVPFTYTSSNPAVATIVNGNIHFVGLGITTITASLGNVVVADVSQNLEVIAPLITFAATRGLAYSTIDVAPAATSTLSSVPITYTSSNPAVATIVNGNIHMVSAGVTTITATQPAIGNSTVPAAATQLLTVATPTTPTLTFAATRSQAFSSTDLDPGATSTITNVPITYTSNNPALVSIVNNKLHFNIPATSTIGNTAIITATQAGAGGIPTQVLSQTLTVTPAIIIQNPLTKYYGDPDFSPGVSTLGSGYPVLYTSATTTVATTVTNGNTISPGQFVHIIAPGTSILSATQLADAVNTVAPAAQPCTLTVVAAPMSITPKNVTFTYGSPLISFPLIYDGFKSASGTFPLDDSTKFSTQPIVSINGRAPNGFFGNIPVGTYQLTASGAVSTLYAFTYGKGTLTIVPAVQTLTWNNFNGNRSIADPDSDPLARSTGDPVSYTSSNTAVATISGVLTLGTPIGGSGYTPTTSTATYTGVSLTGGTGTGATATITVTNGAVTGVTITNAGNNYSAGDVLTAAATAIGGTGTGFTVKVATTNNLLHITGVGTSTITANLNPTSGNYTGSASISKTLTVGPGAQTITVATIPYLTRGAAAYSPNATASSGLAVTMVSSDPTIVKVVGATLVPLHVGSVTITFSQAGNANYTAAPNVTQYVQVVDPSGSVVKVDQAVSPNGDGINDFLYIEGLQNYPDNHVKIINRNGDKVYGTIGYNNKDVAFTGKDSSGHYLPAGTYFYLIDWTAGGDNYHITGYFVLKY